MRASRPNPEVTQMSSLMSKRPSATCVVAVLALSFAIVGSAIAGTDASKKALSKSQVKKIAKKIAKKQAKKAIKKQAPGLSVAHATSADSATTAVNADAPSIYAHVTATGTAPNVDEARSKGFTDADFVDTGSAGVYCVNLPSGYKTASGIQDEPLASSTSTATVHVFPDGGVCAGAGLNGNTIVLTVQGATTVRADFDLQVYR
jgi:hypothetical protein